MKRILACLAVALGLSGCAGTVPPSIVTQPTMVRPIAPTVPLSTSGGIYQPVTAHGWFEDKQPHRVGDNITVQLEEKVSASSAANNAAERSGALSTQIGGAGGTTSKTFGSLLNGLNLTATHDDKYTGTGQTSASNSFNGLITVMVTDVLANGNLVIAGEKQVNIRGEISHLRVSGIINPSDIQAGNVISSTRVAEARIEEMGSGTVAAADQPGWLQRFFFSFMPF
jgi:flagellar L-ring protein precursor FlgH